MMYLGGNGFYWSVGIDPKRPEVVEVRRSEGVRTWTSAPGERRHQTDGRLGGTWRARGRPPNVLVGLGFSAYGFSGDGQYFVPRDIECSTLPAHLRAAISKVGESPFGVAGLELERHSTALGSPAAIVLGKSANLPAGYMPAIEDVEALDALLPDPIRSFENAARGDIIVYRHAGGGLCFSVGSIRWASGLSDPADQRHVQSITEAAFWDLLAEHVNPDSESRS